MQVVLPYIMRLEQRLALHTAVLRRKGEIVQLLLEHGADINVRVRGMTATDAAKILKNNEIVELLRKHGAKE